MRKKEVEKKGVREGACSAGHSVVVYYCSTYYNAQAVRVGEGG